MSFTINDDVTLTSSASIDNIRISGNTISSTDTDGYIVLAPNGNGTVRTGNLQLTGNTISSTDTNGHIVLAPHGNGTVRTGNLQLTGNIISSTDTNGHIVLAPNGNGTVRTDNLQLGGNTISSTNTDGDLLLAPNGNGNVGIGTSSPSSKLHINTSNYVGASIKRTNNGGAIMRFETTQGAGYVDIGVDSITPNMFMVAGGTKRMTIEASSGNVGIGTSSPVAKLDVGGSYTNGRSLQLRSGDNSTNTDSAQIIFSYNNASYDNGGYSHSIRTRHNGSATSGNAIDFWLWNYGVDTTSTLGSLRVMTLDGTGNVGIGTSSPEGMLHISSGTSGDCVLILEADTDNNNEADNPAIWFRQDRGINESSISLGDNKLIFNSNVKTGGGFAFYTGTTDNKGTTSPLTGSSERMTITSSGNVGIGTTSPSYPLTFDAVNGTKICLWSGSSTMYGFGISNYQLNYHIDDNTNSRHVFYRGGTNGNGTELMRITGSGNVGIGTTNPSAPLHVAAGDIKLNAYDNGEGHGIFFRSTISSAPGDGTYNMSITSRGFGSPNTPDGLLISGVDGIGFATGISNTYDANYVRMLIHNSGIGIGTMSPAAKLDIGGNTDGQVQAILTRGLDTNFQLQAINESSSSTAGDIVSKFGLRYGTEENALFNFIRGSGASDGSLAIVTNKSERMRVNSSGNVGIGTTSPGTKLHITNTTSTSINLVTLENVSDNTVLGTTKMIVMNNLRNYNSYNQESLSNTCGTDIITVNGDNDVRYSGFTLTELSKLRVEYDYPTINSYTSSSFCIYTNGGSGNTEKIRVTGAGNVGINQSTPNAKLDIAATSGQSGLRVTGDAGGNDAQVFLKDSTYGLSIKTNNTIGTRYAFWARNSVDGTIMYAGNNGNVGIGISSPVAKLDVGGSQTNGRSLQLRSGDNSNNTDSAQIILSYNNASYDNGGFAHSIRTRHNGTAASGNAIDFWLWNHGVDTTSTLGSLRVMTLDGTGNVGIGTTIPGTRLEVNGYQTFYDIDLLPGYNSTGDKVPTKMILGNEYCPQIRTFYPNGYYTDGVDLEFWTGGANVITNNMSSRLTIKALTGNVGIGTTSPTEKLEIAGKLKHQGLTLNEGTSPNVDEVKTFNLTVSFNTTTWTDVGIYREDLASGSYIIQLFVNSTSGVVANRETFYTGFMSWFGTNNIYGDPPTYNEILLHHAGRLQWNGSVFYLRTYRDGTAGTLRLQIKNATRAASVSMTFKFRRMI